MAKKAKTRRGTNGTRQRASVNRKKRKASSPPDWADDFLVSLEEFG